MSGWQTRATRTVYENAWVRVREDAVTRPDGSDGVYGVTEMKHPAVFIVPVTAAGEVLLVRMHRYPIDRESIEVPAGGTDGEEPLVAARRELLEETGRSAATWTRLGEFYSLNGVADARADVFLAQHLTGDGEGHDAAAEGISGVLLVAWSDAMDLVRSGAIHDNETIAALMLAGLELGRIR
jgi:8-oxo-dGTP pyrophosphatase MutT (NUDIX family)